MDPWHEPDPPHNIVMDQIFVDMLMTALAGIDQALAAQKHSSAVGIVDGADPEDRLNGIHDELSDLLTDVQGALEMEGWSYDGRTQDPVCVDKAYMVRALNSLPLGGPNYFSDKRKLRQAVGVIEGMIADDARKVAAE